MPVRLAPALLAAALASACAPKPPVAPAATSASKPPVAPAATVASVAPAAPSGPAPSAAATPLPPPATRAAEGERPAAAAAPLDPAARALARHLAGLQPPLGADEPVVAAARARVARRARALVDRFECRRCHSSLPGPAEPQARQCVGCHQAVEAGTHAADAKTQAAWRRHIVHLRFAPPLRVHGRLRAGWIARFLLRPHDVRPALGAHMPRLALAPEQAAVLGLWLGQSLRVPVPSRATAASVSRGRARFAGAGCATCHTGVLTPPPPPSPRRWQAATAGQALAPDLRHVRARMDPLSLVAWLSDHRAPDHPRGPQAGRGQAAAASPLMPRTGFTRAQAQDVADFLLSLPPKVVPEVREISPAQLEPPALLRRPVRWPEVARRVFHTSCWHCHSDADFAYGDGGPGNTGGFGFAPRHVRLDSFGGVHSGMRDRSGATVSLLDTSRGVSPLVRALLARHVEVAGGRVAGVRGMPLGLPPLPLDDIALVRTWVAQGGPR